MPLPPATACPAPRSPLPASAKSSHHRQQGGCQAQVSARGHIFLQHLPRGTTGAASRAPHSGRALLVLKTPAREKNPCSSKGEAWL